jgi:iron complex outermembrane receptor protein
MGKFSINGSVIAICVAACGLTLPSAAMAQDESGDAASIPSELDGGDGEIIVTGSSIRGVAPTGSQLISVSTDDILKQPVSSTANILRKIPQIVNLGADEARLNRVANANANVSLASGINLRGIGTEATLTLMNGRRLVSQGTQSQLIDPSIIPSIMVERMEVIADGASGVYGSDAVAGVVNIITRKKVDGFETRLRAGLADGVEQVVASQIAGTSWDSGSALIAYEYNYRSSLAAKDRPFYNDDLRSVGGLDQRPYFSAPGNVTQGGVYAGIPAGNGVGLVPGDFVIGSANRESVFEGTDILPQQQRHSVMARLDQELSSNVSFYVDGVFSDRQFVRHATARTVNATVPSSNPFFVNPFDPSATRATVSYSFLNDLGTDRQTGYQKVWQATAGLDVQLGSWRADVYFTGGQAKDLWKRNGTNAPALNAALADTNPETALNLYSSNGQNNPATIEKLKAHYILSARNRLYGGGVTLDGPLTNFGDGTIKAAVGGSFFYMQNNGSQVSSENTVDRSMAQIADTEGKREVTSLFAELHADPIDRSEGFVRRVAVSAAGRYDHYSKVGSTFNPKFGTTINLLDVFNIKSSFGKSFRAPTVIDTDPYGSVSIMPMDYVDPNAVGGRARGIQWAGGNPDVKPEKATTWTMGLDLTPLQDKRFVVAATYYNISYKNRIEHPANVTNPLLQENVLSDYIIRNPSRDLVLQLMGDKAYRGDPTEDPSNFVVIVDARKKNVGRLKTSGIDFSVSYNFDLGDGNLSLGANGTRVLTYKRSFVPNVPLTNLLNIIDNPQEFYSRVYADYSIGTWNFSTTWNHTGGYTNNLVTPFQKVDAYDTFDLSVVKELDLGRGGSTISLSVQDVFDKKPPLVINGNLPFDPQVVNIMGRYAAVEFRIKW